MALAEIENSRKMLLDKLKDYKGKDLEVIREASAFACETVEHNNDLQLPPYPSRPPKNSLHLENGYVLQFPSTYKPVRNGTITSDPTNEAKKIISELEKSQKPTGSQGLRKGLGFFVSAASKMVLTLGVVSILSLSGFGPNFAKKDILFKVLGLSQQPAAGERRSNTQCPPGKVLVVENGEARCLVKERVEVPFSSVVAKPDVNYGCG